MCFTFSENTGRLRGAGPRNWEDISTAGCDQGKGTFRVALPQDLKHDGDDGSQAFVIQALLKEEKIMSDTGILYRVPLLGRHFR